MLPAMHLSCQSGVCRRVLHPSGYGQPTMAEARDDAQRCADTVGQDVVLLGDRLERVALFRAGWVTPAGQSEPVKPA